VTAFDRWMESEEGPLCKQISEEVDPKKLAHAIAKLTALLVKKEKGKNEQARSSCAGGESI